MKIEIYYDIRCDKCGAHFSTDFDHGMETNKRKLKEVAKTEGWKYINKQNICPNCVNKVKNYDNKIMNNGS